MKRDLFQVLILMGPLIVLVAIAGIWAYTNRKNK